MHFDEPPPPRLSNLAAYPFVVVRVACTLHDMAMMDAAFERRYRAHGLNVLPFPSRGQRVQVGVAASSSAPSSSSIPFLPSWSAVRLRPPELLKARTLSRGQRQPLSHRASPLAQLLLSGVPEWALTHLRCIRILPLKR